MKTILRSFRHCAITLLLTAASVSASASPSAPVTGVEFLTLPTAQNTDAGQKVEVIEFFAYYCPHCNALQTQLSAWLKKQAPNIVHKRVHIGQGPSANSQQRLYFTLESMGLVEKFQSRVFDAIHVAAHDFGSTSSKSGSTCTR